MQNKITKCQQRKTKRADRLRDLLQLTPTDSILLDACARKQASDVKDILDALPEINPDTIRDNHLRTPLHIACGRRDNFSVATSIAKLLVTAGADVNNGVGDIDGLQPLHMAVLAGNHQCVLMLLHEGANIPATDPFRLTPLLLAKLKMDNLRQHAVHGQTEWATETAKSEYQDLESITQVLVQHLAKKHMPLFELPSSDSNASYYGLSDFLFSREDDQEMKQTISLITDKLALIGMRDQQTDDEIIKGLIEKVKKLGI
ncbi:ankyrin repeat-containing domain protein [Choanephora cucurbitarum]|nr:ankyrin repeat-containing domain protein [Choanephora cucurbitarum]